MSSTTTQTNSSVWSQSNQIITKWSLEWSLVAKWMFTQCVDKWSGKYILESYATRLKPYLPILSETKSLPKTDQVKNELFTSGIMCFYGAQLLNLCETRNLDKTDDIFMFTALYLLIDHYIDDPTVTQADKQNLLTDIMATLEGRSSESKTRSDRSELINIILSLLMIRNPKAVKALRKVFEFEVKSLKVQSNSKATYEEYLKISRDKGGATVEAIQAILGYENEHGYNLGAVIQLVDDIVDIDFDLRDNIHTIATHEYHRKGHIDELIQYTLNEIDQLPREYNIFKPICVQMILYAIDRRTYLSQSAPLYTKYTLFEYKGVTPALIAFDKWVGNSIKAVQDQT